MPETQLELIRQYCDTSHVRLNAREKDLLCKVLERPWYYNGFTSRLKTYHDSGKDPRGRWESVSEWQYRIIIDSALRIDKRYRHECDGYEQAAHWDWDSAWQVTNVREILEILREIEPEL